MEQTAVVIAEGSASVGRHLVNLGSENCKVWVRQETTARAGEWKELGKVLAHRQGKRFSEPEVKWHSIGHVPETSTRS